MPATNETYLDIGGLWKQCQLFGRPAFLYTLLLVIALWVTPNIWPRRFGVRQFDPLRLPGWNFRSVSAHC
jgi:hypothetical protein